jgi:hypothetical protein
VVGFSLGIKEILGSAIWGHIFTLLLHKGVIESAAYHHKKAVSTTLMIP